MRSQDIPWQARARLLVAWALALLASLAALVAPMPFSSQVALRVGDVATADIVAPRQITYVSEILTDERRALAANAVADVYDAHQVRIGRQQLTVANQLLDYIGSVRSDAYADPTAKSASLRAITVLDLPAEVITRSLSISTAGWERVAAEVLVVLERVLREDIRENTLADERRKVPARVRLDMPEEDAVVVSAIVQGLLVPNSFFNAERTEQQRQLARDRVEPITTTLERNETILRTGDIVTPLDVEALARLGLQQQAWTWEDVRGSAGFLLLIGLLLVYYLWRQEPRLWLDASRSLLLPVLFFGFLLSARAALPARQIAPYLFPYAALTIALTILVNLRIALVVSGMFVLVVGWLTGGNLELMVLAAAGSLMGALKVRRGERLANYAWAAGHVLLANLLVVAVFRLTEGAWDPTRIATLIGAAAANGLLTITVALLAIYLLGAIFAVITPLQLMELSRPTHPLLRHLLLKAPGTYHHTLIVSNMSERAAEEIGADALLARVGAYYHDVGKTIRPYFFTENRTEGLDPHTRLDPYTSAQIIITHVKDGIDLARKYRLPRAVINFIPEHQGTLLVSYFYHQAKEQAEKPDTVDLQQFRYPGPRPRSKETAITMLADGAEATARSKHPASVEEVEKIVAESVQSRMLSGQLDESALTFQDLQDIQRVFVDVLRGLHHPRITYPSEAIRAPLPETPDEAPHAITPAPSELAHGAAAPGDLGAAPAR